MQCVRLGHERVGGVNGGEMVAMVAIVNSRSCSTCYFTKRVKKVKCKADCTSTLFIMTKRKEN